MTQDSLINTSENISLGSDKKQPFFTAAMGHNFRSNIKENIKLFIVLIMLHFAAAPLIALSAVIQIAVTKYSPELELYMVIGVCTTGAAALAGILCVMSCFDYLHKKSAVDMKLCLPMSVSQRFVSDFFSGLFIYVVPFLLNQAITWIVMLIGHLAYDGKTFISPYDPIYNEWTGAYEPIVWECNIFEETAPILWRGILGGIALMLMFYVFAVIVAGCCGRVFEFAVYTVLTNILVPLTLLALIAGVTNNVQGVVMESYAYIVSYTSPGGGVYGLITSIVNDTNFTDMYSYETVYPVMEELSGTVDPQRFYYYSDLTFVKWTAVFFIVTVILGVLSYFIYRRRSAEDTGKPIVFSLFYHFIMTLAIVSISYSFMLDGMDYGRIVPMAVTVLIIYLVFHVIRKRSFKGIVKACVICAGTLVLSAGSLMLIYRTHGLGAESYVPSPDSVASVSTDYAGLFDPGYFGIMGRTRDPEIIRAVTEAHRQAVESIDSDVHKTTVDVKYKLKSGRTVIRSLNIPDEGMLTLSAADSTDYMKKFRAYKNAGNISELEQFYKYRFENSYDGNELYVLIAPQFSYSSSSVFSSSNAEKPLTDLPEDFFAKLAEYMAEDIINETEEDYFTPKGNVWSLWSVGYRIEIKENYVNTLAYLKQCGFEELPELDVNLTERLLADFGVMMGNTALSEYLDGKDYVTCPALYPMSNDEYYYGNGRFVQAVGCSEKLSAELSELLACSHKTYKTDESCYTIFVNGNGAVIPPEYSERAEKAYICLAVKTAEAAAYQTERNDVTNASDPATVYGIADTAISEEYYIQEYDSGRHGSFLKGFMEFYGEESIIAALKEYYPENYGELYSLLNELAAENAS